MRKGYVAWLSEKMAVFIFAAVLFACFSVYLVIQSQYQNNVMKDIHAQNLARNIDSLPPGSIAEIEFKADKIELAQQGGKYYIDVNGAKTAVCTPLVTEVIQNTERINLTWAANKVKVIKA